MYSNSCLLGNVSVLVDLLTKLQGAVQVDKWSSEKAVWESESQPQAPHASLRGRIQYYNFMFWGNTLIFVIKLQKAEVWKNRYINFKSLRNTNTENYFQRRRVKKKLVIGEDS